MQQVFDRVEKKYLLTKNQMDTILSRLKGYIKESEYTNYTICNIYFDTDSYSLIRTSIDKPLYKEKVRLRSYGIPNNDSKVFLEIKKKYKKVVNKRRITLSLEEMKKYLNNRHAYKEKSQIMKEIDYLFDYYELKPKLYLAYDRTAYVGINEKELRITFDHNIRSRENDLFLEHGCKGESLLSNDTYLMEIKVPGAFPLYLSRLLSELEIFPISFSKYGSIYQSKVLKEIKEFNTSKNSIKLKESVRVKSRKRKNKEEGVIYV